MRRLTGWLVLGLLVLFAPAVSAQTPQVNAGQAFTATFNHDAVNTTGYRIYVDGTKSGADVPMTARNQAGLVTVSVAGQPAGNHTLQVTAFGAGGESPKTAPLAVTSVVPAPTTPSNLQIVISVAINADGTADLVAFNVRKD